MSTTEIGQLLEREGVIGSATVFRYYVRLNGPGHGRGGRLHAPPQRGHGGGPRRAGGRGRGRQGRAASPSPRASRCRRSPTWWASCPGGRRRRSWRWRPAAWCTPSYQRHRHRQPRGAAPPRDLLLRGRRRRDRHPPAAWSSPSTPSPPGSASRAPPPASSVTPVPGGGRSPRWSSERPRCDEDRAKIARVIYNRLARRTCRCRSTPPCSTPWASTEERSCSSPTSRSTRPTTPTRRRACRPGPIAAPGQASLEAALHPDPGPWLYYVVIDDSGTPRLRHDLRRAQPQHRRGRAERRALSPSQRRGRRVGRLAAGRDTRLAAVIGSPVRHSLSPAMHNAAFRGPRPRLGLPRLRGGARTASPAALAGMRALGIGGLSVTMPHKEDAAAAVDELLRRRPRRPGRGEHVVTRRRRHGCGARTPTAPASSPPLTDDGVRPGRPALPGAGRGRCGPGRGAGAGRARARPRSWSCRPRPGPGRRRRRPWPGRLGRRGRARPRWRAPRSDRQRHAARPATARVDLAVDAALLGPGQVVVDLVPPRRHTPAARRPSPGGRRRSTAWGCSCTRGRWPSALWTGCEPPVDVMRAAVRS